MYGSYEKLVFDSLSGQAARPTAIDYNAAAGNIYATRPFMEPASVTRFGFQVGTAFSLLTPTANMQLKLYRCPAGVLGSRIELATMDVPAGAIAANMVVICDVDNAYVPATKVAGVITVRARNKADLDAGDVVQIAIATGANGATETGNFHPFICYNNRPESIANQAMVVDLTP